MLRVAKRYLELIRTPFFSHCSCPTNGEKGDFFPEFMRKMFSPQNQLSAFKYLVELKESHSKVRSIEYNKLETQRYLTSPIFSNEDVGLRSRTLN